MFMKTRRDEQRVIIRIMIGKQNIRPVLPFDRRPFHIESVSKEYFYQRNEDAENEPVRF
jgi:hypothetical protein